MELLSIAEKLVEVTDFPASTRVLKDKGTLDKRF